MWKLLPEDMKSASFEDVKATIIAGYAEIVAGRSENRLLERRGSNNNS